MKNRAIWTCWLGLILAGVLSSGGLAQRAAAQSDNLLFRPPPRDVLRPLNAARKAIEQRDYGEAANYLGTLLAGDRQDEASLAQDFFLAATDEPGTRTSLKAEAERLLGSLPASARELYELQFGALARAMLDEALQEADLQKLGAVTRKYFHTRAGYEATLVLGRYQLDHGRPLAAALCFERLARTPAARDRYDPELSLLLAACWRYARLPDKVRDTLVGLKQRQAAGQGLQVQGQRRPWFDDPAAAPQWLDELLGIEPQIHTVETPQWMMFRGNATRNARSAGGEPLVNFRWRVPTVNTEDALVEQKSKEYRGQNQPALPALQPLAVDNVVLMRTAEGLLGVDFESGKRIWPFPWDMPSGESPQVGQSGQFTGSQNDRSSLREMQLSERLWEDAAHGQISSDGRSVFLLDQLGYTASGVSPQAMFRAGGLMQADPHGDRSHNVLVALDLKRQGAARWMVGGESGEDEPQLAGAFFLGPPLPVADQLYVLAELNGEIRLVVLDARTGGLQWAQQLAHVETRTIQVDTPRRLAAATPSLADGVLICPTSAGAVVAVDATTRALLWGYQYEQLQPMRHHPLGFRHPNSRQQMAEPGKRWADATVTVAEGCVLLTPVESDEFYCLDLLTGETRWPPREREDLLFVACVHQGQVVLVGQHEVTAWKLDDGSDAWPGPVELGEAMPSGRGFYSGGHYYLPTTEAELLQIDVAQGRIVSRSDTGSVLGNLVCYKDQVISQGVDHLTVFHQIGPLRQRVEARLAKDPQDPWALARQGELLLQEGKRPEALAALRKAHELDPDDANRVLLVQALLGALEDDFTAHRQVAAEVEDLIDQPDQHRQYLRRMARGLEQSGQLQEAFEFFLKLAALNQPGSGALEQLETQLSVRRDHWVRTRLARLIAAAEGPQRERMNQVVQQRLEAARQDGSMAAWRQFLRDFDPLPLAQQARLEMVTGLIDSGELLEAELLLAPLRQSDDPALAAPAIAHTARLLETAGRLAPASAWYQLLGQRYGDVVCLEGRTGQQLLDAARDNPELAAAWSGSDRWPTGKTEVESTGEQSSSYAAVQTIFPITVYEGPEPVSADLSVSFDRTRHNLLVRDKYRDQTFQVSLPRSNNVRYHTVDYSLFHARAHGHLLIVSLGTQLLAIDALRGFHNPRRSDEVILWQQDLVASSNSRQVPVRPKAISSPWGDTQYIPINSEGRLVGQTGPLHPEGICYQRMAEVVCVEPLTGETLWTRHQVPPGAELFGDQELLFVLPPDSGQCLLLNAADGELAGRPTRDRSETVWATSGRNVLAWKQHNDQLQLRLYNLATGQELWKRPFPLGSKGQIVEDQEVAILQPDGQFVVLSLSDAEPQLQARLEPDPALREIYMLRSRDQYLLITNQPNVASPEVRAQPAPGGRSSPLINGRVYAFDRHSGQTQWKQPVKISQYGLPLDQPAEQPLLIFLRHLRPTSQRAAGANHTWVLGLDKRTGRVVLEEEDIPFQARHYFLVAEPEKKTVALTLQTNISTATSGRTFTVSFTDEPLPPEPEDADKASRLPDDPASNVFRHLSGALLKAFGGQDAPERLQQDPQQELEQDSEQDPFQEPAEDNSP